MRRQAIQQPQKNTRKRLIVLVLLLIAVATAIFLILELTGRINLIGKKAPDTTANQYTKGEQTPSKQTENTPDKDREGNTQTDTKGQSDEPVNPSENIQPPTGIFVSAHKISLGTNPPLQSTCESIPKVTCQITFTKDGTSVHLEPKTTDDGGAAYWTWQPKELGLTSGSWKVQAKVTKGGSSSTADDALTLDITP